MASAGVPQLRSSRTEVNVVYTTREATIAALATANILAKDLDITVRVLAFQVVPYPLNIDEPPVAPAFLLNRIATELKAVHGDMEFEIHYASCRDSHEALVQYLNRPSVVIIGGKGGIRRARQQGVVRTLEGMGHDVVYISAAANFKTTTIMIRCWLWLLGWFFGHSYGRQHTAQR
jgi:hypothetical protein